MFSSLFNLLLGASQFVTQHQQPLLSKTQTTNMRGTNRQFELKSSPDILSPKDLISLPRPAVGVANPDKADLVFVPVSQYSFETKKTNKTIYIAPLEASTTPIEFPIITGGEAFWLDSRTLAHVVEGNIYAVSLEYAIVPNSLISVPRAPYLVGSFPSGSSPSNFKFTGTRKLGTAGPDGSIQHLLVFSAKVYDDYNLTSVKEQDAAWEARGSSALVYDELYVRHWDEYSSNKRSRLFSVELNLHGSGDDAKWTLGKDYFKPLEFTEHYTPVEPFGGTDDFDVSGSHIVYTTKDPSVPEATHTRQNVYVVPLKGGLEPRPLTTGHQGATHSPVFSPNGRLVAWTELAKDGYESDRAVVVLYDLKTNARWKVTEDWDRSVQQVLFSDDNDTLFVTASEHGHVKIFTIPLPKDLFLSPNANHPKFPTPTWLTYEHSSHGLQALPDNKLLFSQSSLRGPSNVFLASLDGEKVEELKIITTFGRKELKEKKLDVGESFWFEGADKHRQVHGWSLKPHGYDESLVAKGKKWPAVFLIHGGPQGAWEDGWSTRWNPNVFAQAGYWVIAVNPTGSTGFGQDFTDAITREWGGKPFVDLKKGWEHALKHYPIDKHRAAAAGASWGGFAINWIQGHPDYEFGFKALFCHDGIFDTRNGGYTTDELYFWDHDFGGLPWSKKARELADKYNPSEFVHKWSTPQLIVHGGKDYRLAETEGLAAFNALQQRGVPSRLVLFPDENHWVLNPANSLKWHYEVFRWFDQWVGDDVQTTAGTAA